MGKSLIDTYDEYNELMLFLKHLIAKSINHNAEAGHCREMALREWLTGYIPNLQFLSGFIESNGVQSPQCDIVVCKSNSINRPINDLNFVSPSDCLMVIEVKTTLTIEDLENTSNKNVYFNKHKETEHIKRALFCYSSAIAEETLLKYFGFKYNDESCSYEHDVIASINIDQFLCIHRDFENDEGRLLIDTNIAKQLYLMRDHKSNKFFQYRDFPISRNFVNFLNSL